ncbi:hypothetical protein [Sphingobium sp.]
MKQRISHAMAARFAPDADRRILSGRAGRRALGQGQGACLQGAGSITTSQ